MQKENYMNLPNRVAQRGILFTALLSFVLSVGVQQAKAQYNFNLVDAPGSTDQNNTVISGINDAGVTVGYDDTSGPNLSFIRSSSGVFTRLNVGGSSFTYAGGINNANQVVGIYNISGFTHSFLWQGGVYTNFDVPGAIRTYARGINDSGTIVGDWRDASFVSHAFLRTSNGAFTTFDIAPNLTAFNLLGINNLGQTVGAFSADPSQQIFTPFLRAADGALTTFATPGFDHVVANGINDLGQITGFIQNNASGEEHGFVRQSNGILTYLDSDPLTYYQTIGNDINNRGVIVGEVDDITNFDAHGFIATAVVPEPGSLALLLTTILGGIGLVVRRRHLHLV